MKTNLLKVAEEIIYKLENFAIDNSQADAYHFEKGIVAILKEGNNQFMQAVVGKIPKGENSKVSVTTTFSEITVSKTHPMSRLQWALG